MIINDAPSGAYPPAGRRCMSCGMPLRSDNGSGICSKDSKRTKRTCAGCGTTYDGWCQSRCCSRSCYWANRRAVSADRQRISRRWNALIRHAMSFADAKTIEPLHDYSCCGWMLRGTHDPGTPRHRIGINRYMRNRYRSDITWQLSYMLGTQNSQEQARLPASLFTVALTRRRMMEAARLVGAWRVNDDQVNDPS